MHFAFTVSKEVELKQQTQRLDEQGLSCSVSV